MSIEATIRRWDADRVRAMQDADLGTLERLLHPSGSYVHGSGVADSFPAYIDKLRSGASRYTDARIDVEHVVTTEHAAFVSGRFRANVHVASGIRQLDAVAGITWFRFGEDWRVVSIQNTKAPSSD